MRKQPGFSLIELAVVLIIVTLVLGGLLRPLSTEIERSNVVETDRQLKQIKEALLGYVAANRRLPCPAIESSAGKESFATGGSAANGNCSSFAGFLPAGTLGITPVDAAGFALDGWGTTSNRIRYAVYSGTINGVANPFTRTDGVRNATMASVASATRLLVVCAAVAAKSSPTCTGASLTDMAPFLVYSLGRNASSDTSGASANEGSNLNTDHVFVAASVNRTAGKEFDDQLSWESPHTVFSRMIAAGALP
ncbi:type II secretion system GspH family protein [Massilia oculi]|uniref:Type II secretion system GspH family protein n=1 Tax=Massilia hydrophila TaxID=3044279 RepID=A0ABS7YFL8_9BURK|nr:type II secretion system protein [Massilia oculi]MCA1857105.1 type II secretion system GspH family protein [Massilia oculi]